MPANAGWSGSVALCALLSVVAPPVTRAAQAPFREQVLLNGIWDFYPEGGTARHDIRVPSFWDAPQDYGYPAEWLHMRHGIYKRHFDVPASWEGKEIFLKIQRVSVVAKVFVNGTQVGGETTGGYLMMMLPYLIDITAVAQPGRENLLEVRAWGGQSVVHGIEEVKAQQDFPPDVLDGTKPIYPTGVDAYDGRRGINGDVLLIATPKVRIADVFVIPDLRKNADPTDDVCSLRFSITNSSAETAALRLVNRAIGATRKVFEDVEVTVPARATREVELRDAPWPDAAYWWPHDPRLYTLETVLISGVRVLDRVDTRFGFRQFYVDGAHFALNGVRANLRGDAYEFSWHEGYRHGPSTAPVLSTKELTIETQKRLLDEYKKLNLNILRVHKASAIEELYDYCDRIGMMVIDEAPFWQTQQRTSLRGRANFEEWSRRMVLERRNHPSIVMWSAANECWGSPFVKFSMDAILSADASRPVIHDGETGDQGDEYCAHYTGGYPMKIFNAAAPYEIFKRNPNRPTGEGEALFADGWPLKNEEGSLSEKRGERGQWDHPDLISQAEWLRGVSRMIRAMRYAGLDDIRLYADWMLNFDPIEADIEPRWPDLSAPGLKPVILRRPISNTFTDRYPAVIPADGAAYYRNSNSPVAVFDPEWDAANRLGSAPVVYHRGDRVDRKPAVYNDEFAGGTRIKVAWEVSALDPQSGARRKLAEGSTQVDVPYGEMRPAALAFTVPADAPAGWLIVTLSASKAPGGLRFQEDNRLGAIEAAPAPKLTASPHTVDLGAVGPGASNQLHKIRLVNVGGGMAEPWSAAGSDDRVALSRTSGNLRGEQEVYFMVRTEGLEPGREFTRVLKFTAKSGSSDAITVRFNTGRGGK